MKTQLTSWFADWQPGTRTERQRHNPCTEARNLFREQEDVNQSQIQIVAAASGVTTLTSSLYVY